MRRAASRCFDGARLASLGSAMVSVEHQWLVELFRNGRALAPALLRLCAGVELPHHHIAESTTDLSELVSAEYRVDATSSCATKRTAAPRRSSSRSSWGATSVNHSRGRATSRDCRARLECPVYLLVFCNDAAVARWAQQAIALGHPGFELAPIVIEAAQLPRSVDHS